MKKIRLEFCNDEIMTLVFALQKAIFYTDNLDPAFVPFTYENDKKRYLDGYRKMFFKLRVAMAHLAFLDDPDNDLQGTPSWLVNPFNGEIVDSKPIIGETMDGKPLVITKTDIERNDEKTKKD